MWKTKSKKDGSQTLDQWFLAANPRYVEVHKEWEWIEVAPSTTGAISPGAAAVPGYSQAP